MATKKEIAISIHSLVKRETADCAIAVDMAQHFNPLPRKEGDCYIATVIF